MKPRMKPRIMLIGLMVLMIGTDFTTKPQSTQSEILVIDLSKQLPGNPYQQEYEKMLYPTVRIRAGNSTGSGVIFHRPAKDGINSDTETRRNYTYILSAAHVVDNYSEVQVEIYRSLTDTLRLSAFVVITDTAKDLALLCVLSLPVPKIGTQTGDLCGEGIYFARLAPADYRPYIFTPVYSVGCSLGLIPRPSEGIITYISDLSVLSGQTAVSPANRGSYWEISAPILPGNSGGPVYDGRTYEVIGIAVWVHTYSAGGGSAFGGKGQLITTMAGIVPVNQIYEFLTTDTHR